MVGQCRLLLRRRLVEHVKSALTPLRRRYPLLAASKLWEKCIFLDSRVHKYTLGVHLSCVSTLHLIRMAF